MCGRYGFVPKKDFYDRFKIENRLENLEENYNVTPGALMPVITKNSPTQVQLMKWGLIPHWAKDPKIGYKMINARADTLLRKPSFRKPFLTQRCLIPATGFYEWKHEGKDKIPYYFKVKSEDVFAFAGLYETWKDAEGYPIKTFTIITTEPNEIVAKVHNRMPAIMKKDFEEMWLDKELQDAKKLMELIIPYNPQDMEMKVVSSEINNPNSENQKLFEYRK